uniref:Kelch-like protein 20 n=1 Tax=Phallusia mammillata TaxID=59560 RepID=A0A6F9DGW1_9ASCI|nr:kelch-like protein 20 [Phallusia mammillata]
MRPSLLERRTHQENILSYLNLDRKGAKRHCDKVLQSDEKTYPVHACIIGAASDYFRTMFEVEMKEKYQDVVPVENIPHKRLERLLDFAYLGDIEVTEDNVVEVLEDAEYTQMKELKVFCNNCILQMVSVENCLKVRAHALRYNLENVVVMTNETIAQNFPTIFKQESFLQLDVGDVSDIIQLRNNNCEETVFNGIVQWVKYNPLQRDELFVSLFSQLNLSSMGTDFLSEIYKEELVLNNFACNKMLLEAFIRLNKPASVKPDTVVPRRQGIEEDAEPSTSAACRAHNSKHRRKTNYDQIPTTYDTYFLTEDLTQSFTLNPFTCYDVMEFIHLCPEVFEAFSKQFRPARVEILKRRANTVEGFSLFHVVKFTSGSEEVGIEHPGFTKQFQQKCKKQLDNFLSNCVSRTKTFEIDAITAVRSWMGWDSDDEGLILFQSQLNTFCEVFARWNDMRKGNVSITGYQSQVDKAFNILQGSIKVKKAELQACKR